MVLYECPRCGYSIERKSSMKDHIYRKKICKPVCKDVNPKELEEKILKGISEKDIIKRLEKQVKELKQIEELKQIQQPQPLNITNNTNNTNNITNNITIVLPHRDPNLEYLTDKDYLHCINRMIMSVPRLIEKIHFDPEHPENHNIYINNIKNKMALTYDGKQWNLQNRDQTIDKLITDHEYIMEEWLENGEDNFPKAKKKFDKYIGIKDQDGVVNEIKEEIKLLLYNNRNIIKK
jgi:hypothetical protein